MRKRLFVALLGLSIFSLASCGEEKIDMPKDEYYLDENSRNYLESLVQDDTIALAFSSKKIVIRKESYYLGDNLSTSMIKNIDLSNHYMYSYLETESSDKEKSINEQFVYEDDDQYIWLSYTNGNRDVCSFINQSFFDSLDVYKDVVSTVERFSALKTDNSLWSVESFDLYKAGSDDFYLRIDALTTWPEKHKVLYDFEFKNGLPISFGWYDCTSKVYAVKYEFSYDVDFQENHPDVSAEDVRQSIIATYS